MSSKQESTAGPTAFGIKLGMSLGRSSPVEDAKPQTITVNADTTVNYIFLQSAYVLSHIHGGKSSAALQEDYDVVMLRPGRGDIVLNPTRVIADYHVVKNDMFDLRPKTRPLPVLVNLCEGKDKKIEVNSGFPLMDIIPNICQQIGIKNHSELSLALPSSGGHGQTMKYEWLDLSNSLHGQGIHSGDTLLLRKKFFILNDDVKEAVEEGNAVLSDLIYHQVKEMFTSQTYTGARKTNMEACVKISALLHHIEQKDENISDEECVRKVVPKELENNDDFYNQIVMIYYQERIGTRQTEEARHLLFHLLSSSQSVLINYFPVKRFDTELHEEELLLVVDSSRISVCNATISDCGLKSVDGMEWRLRDLREAECTTEKDHHLRLNILGSWFEFLTDHRTQISRYLLEARDLIKEKVKRNRVSVANGNADRNSVRFSQNLEQNSEASGSSSGDEYYSTAGSGVNVIESSVDPEPVIVTASKQEDDRSQEVGVVVSVVEETQPETDDEKDVKSTGGSVTETVTEVAGGKPELEEEVNEQKEEVNEQIEEVNEAESKVVEVEQEVKEPELEEPHTPLEVNVEIKSVTSQPEQEEAERETRENSAPISVSGIVTDESVDLDDIRDDTSRGSPSVGSLTITRTHVSTEPAQSKEDEVLSELPSPTKSKGTRSSVSSTFIHIPEFVGLDYREVLEDYKLFQVVVMKKDVRSILLNIKKPVREVLESLCRTFDMPNTGTCYLWIPTGIQRIIEKYGGRPRSRIGRFVKRHQVGGDFTPRLDMNKSLEEQYNFNIKPYLLHLRGYQSDNSVDGPGDNIDCGQEWPDCDNPDVPRYRKFYQSWTGVVQGIYPIERKGAVKLAALLTQIYYGDREKSTFWPPYDYDPKMFLPETHKSRFGIANDVEKAHKELSGKHTVQECINLVIEDCEKLPTICGVFFEVAEPIKGDFMKFIPRNKMEGRWFGISQNGIFSINKETEEVNFHCDLTEISKWTFTESSFKLSLVGREFDAYTYQAREILDTLDLFIQMRVRYEKTIAPDKPTSLEIAHQTTLADTPDQHLSVNKKTPLNLDSSRKQSILSATSYDL